MRQLLFVFFLLLALPSLAQTGNATKGYIDGTAVDSLLKIPISYATVNLMKQADSTFVQAVSADSVGYFKLPANSGKYILEIYFMGYKKFHKNVTLSKDRSSISLGKIYMKEDAILLNEAVVVAEVPAIVVKGDTIEYNSSAYETEENALLRDLIKNIPGMEVDGEGSITANGKPISKILVDGKEFFGNDIALALGNLPANMIKKLQLFKEESESSKVSGIKDKDPKQVLNLVVEDELKQSIFGNTKVGYGGDDRYTAKGIANYMHNETQATILGEITTISDNSYSAPSGEDKEHSIGANIYAEPFKKFKIGAHTKYTSDVNLLETRTNTQTYLESGDRFSKQTSRSNSKRENIGGGFNINWEIDSLTTVYARSGINFSNANNRNTNSGFSYVPQTLDSTITASDNRMKGDSYSINNSLTAGRKIGTKGRTISFTLSHNSRRGKENGTNISTTDYTGAIPSILIDQKINTDTKSDSYGISVSYVEPLDKNHSLQFVYSYSKNESERSKDAWKKDLAGDYTQLDSAYTRQTENSYISQSVNINFQSVKEKLSYSIGFSVDPSQSTSNIFLRDSVIEDLKQNVINFSPTFNLSYAVSDNANWDINYNGRTNQPGISQLSADTVIVNPSYKTYGNPDLKTSFSNSLSFYYQKSDYEIGRFYMFMGGFNYTMNNIASYTIIDSIGNTENTFRNVNGDMSGNLGFVFNTPFRNKKWSVNSSSHINYNRSVGFTNEKKATTNSIMLSQQGSIRFKSKTFENNLRINLSYNITKNNLSNLDSKNTATYNFRNFSRITLPYDFSIQNEFSYSRYSGYGGDFKKNETLWNASISKLFLRNKKGTLKLEFFDILNNRNNISRVVTGTYTSDSRSNSINRYFLFTFAYQFNIFKKRANNEQSPHGYYDIY